MNAESVVLIILVITVGAWFMYRSETKLKRPRKKREAALRQVAERMGFTYEPHGDPFKQEPRLHPSMTSVSRQLNQAFYGYPHFLRGRGAREDVTIFDVWHGGGARNGKSDAQHPFQTTMAGFHLDDLRLPPMTIAPERRSDRFSDVVLRPLQILGESQDLDFEEHPSFSDRYSLRSREPAWTRSLFSPTFIAFWESLPEEDRLSAAAIEHSLVVYRQPKSKADRKAALPPEEYETFVRQAEAVVAAFRAQIATIPPEP